MEPFKRRATSIADSTAAMIQPLSMNLPLTRPSGTLSPSEGERDGVRGRLEGSGAQGALKVWGILSWERGKG